MHTDDGNWILGLYCYNLIRTNTQSQEDIILPIVSPLFMTMTFHFVTFSLYT